VRISQQLKGVAGRVVAGFSPQCDFGHAVFVIGHMRCGSTALSNILVDRPEISGYGEAHIAYRSAADLGTLVLNQRRRGSWRASAPHLFDKILHSRYDAVAGAEFFGARAVFVARRPAATIGSIRTLFAALGSTEYDSDAACAAYLEERMATMLALWPRFQPARRLALTHAALIGDTERSLTAVSTLLGLTPPLRNAYAQRTAAQARGAGDPLAAHMHTRIEARPTTPGPATLAVPAAVMARLDALYAEIAGLAR
jgi:hypothetical protein